MFLCGANRGYSSGRQDANVCDSGIKRRSQLLQTQCMNPGQSPPPDNPSRTVGRNLLKNICGQNHITVDSSHDVPR
jgi:hypothetical protein